MRVRSQPMRRAALRPRHLIIAAGLLAGSPALGFPVDDPGGARSSPAARGTLAAPDAQDLRHQMQTVGGASGFTGSGGWIVLPRLDATLLYTDNALQVSNPRQWDVASILAPGIGITADTNRLQLRFDYSPVMSTYARTTSQNTLSHYLNTTGLLTVVPEEVFVDLRALAGVQPIAGGFGGAGGFGLGGTSAGFQAGSLGQSAANSALLNRNNQAQTFSAGISPYWLRQFGDYGTMRIGGSFQYSSASTVTGFGTLPLVTTGTDSQSQFTTEQTGRFVTGEFLGRIQNTTDLTLSQTPMSSATGTLGRRLGSAYSSRQLITNRTSYAVTHAIQVFVTIGYENIKYSSGLAQQIKGLVWDIGTTFYPNPDSTITISYGKREGSTSLAFDGRYTLTPRTVITGSYSSRLATQLQNLQRQLDQGVINANGILVNSQTGAPLAIGNNGLALQPGVFRYDTLTMNIQTTLDRDILSLGAVNTTQSSPTGGTGQPATTARTVTGSWSRELRPDLSLNTTMSYTTQTVSGTSGTSRSMSGSVGLTYLMTDTLTGRIRYAHFTRGSGSGTVTPAFSRLNFSQNLFTVGVTKQF